MEIIVNTITYFSVLLPTLVGLLVFRQLSGVYKFFYFFIVYTSLQEIIRWFLFEYHQHILALNIYGIIETAFLGGLYFDLINNKTWNKIQLIVIPIVCICLLLNLIFVQGLYDLNSYSMMLESLLFILLSTLLFLQFINEVPNKPLLKYEDFWLNLGVFIYFTLSFFVFMMSNELFTKFDLDLKGFHLWDIHDLLNLFLNFSFAMALWFSSKNHVQVEQTKSSNTSN